MRLAILAVSLALAAPCFAAGVDLTLQIPETLSVKTALAVSSEASVSTTGTIDPNAHRITFAKLLADTRYDIALTLADGTVLRGVDPGWYMIEPAKPDAEALGDDDRKAIIDIISDPKSFENRKRLHFLVGDNRRATALVELIRDRDFHASGGNIIWRVELWYFGNQFGGWAKVAQQNRVLRRERFKDQAAFDATVSKIKWVPQLGGIRLAKDKPTAEITLPSAALAPAAATEMPTPAK